MDRVSVIDAVKSASGVFRLGGRLMVLGALLAIFDVLAAGCTSTGPCQPGPPFPLVLPLAVYAIGVTFALANIWRPRVGMN